MEVHTPHEPVTSLRGLVTHLSLVIVGVLIALSFEGVATWREHRALVRDARANLLNEVRDNRNELAERLKEPSGGSGLESRRPSAPFRSPRSINRASASARNFCP